MSADDEPHDPAEDNQYLQGFSRPEPAETDIDREWSELSEKERKAALNDQPLPDEEPAQPDAPADPHAVDWQAFAEEFNFHLAGRGVQSRFTTEHKLEVAVETSDHVATSAPEVFVEEAFADDRVPLSRGDNGRPLFHEEVLADE